MSLFTPLDKSNLERATKNHVHSFKFFSFVISTISRPSMETATELRKTANLCGGCTRAFKHENYRLKFLSGGPLRSVLETAASGCPICVLVRETIRQAGPHWWNDLRYRISPETQLAVWGEGAAVYTASPDSSTREPTDPFHISIFERNEDFAQLDLFRIKGSS